MRFGSADAVKPLQSIHGKRSRKEPTLLAKLCEEDTSLNFLGEEMVGSMADLWQNLPWYDEHQAYAPARLQHLMYQKTKTKSNRYRPPFPTVDPYLDLCLFPL